MIVHVAANRTRVVAGLEDVPVDVHSLPDNEKLARWKEVVVIVTNVARAKTARLRRDEFDHLVAKLTAKPYTIKQLHAAALQLERMDTAHARPLAWECWERAFAEPTFTATQVARRVRDAYERGRRSMEQEQCKEPPEMSDETRAFMQRVREMYRVEQTRDELAANLRAKGLELERANQRIQAQCMEIEQRDTEIAELQKEVRRLQHKKNIHKEIQAA